MSSKEKQAFSSKCKSMEGWVLLFSSLPNWFFIFLWITNSFLNLTKVVPGAINISKKTAFYIQFKGIQTHPCILYQSWHFKLTKGPAGIEHSNRKPQGVLYKGMGLG